MRMGYRTGLQALLILAVSHFSPAAFAARDPELEALFKKGMQALEDNRLKTAREAFQTILTTEPSLHRARLELAVTYYRMLDYQKARDLAQQVLDDPQTPTEVRVTILAFLAQIKADQARFAKRHVWRASVAFGGLHDSNVNVGPSSDVLTDNIRLLPGFTSRSDNALFVQPGISHTFNPGKRVELGEQVANFLWQSQASVYHRRYDQEDNFDLTVASVSTGPALVVLRDWRAAVNLTLDNIWLGGDRLALFSSVKPYVTWQFNRGELTLDATYTRRDYDDTADSGREGDYAAIGGTLGRYFLDRSLALQAGVHYLHFDADADQWGYEGPEVMLAGSLNTWKGGRIYARVTQRDLDYDGDFPVFGVARDERERRFVAGFSHVLRGGYLDQWQLNGEVSRIINGSNVTLFEYDRTQLNLTFSRGFEF